MREATPPGLPSPRRLDRVRGARRARHYSARTEDAYVAWIRRDIFFHGQRHPAEMGAPEVTRFLTSLVVEGRVAASTQNQALSALPSLYRDILEIDLPCEDDRPAGAGGVELPAALLRKYPNAGRATLDATTSTRRSSSARSRTRSAGPASPKRGSPHALPHSFATQRLEDGPDIRTVPQRLGHRDVSAPMISTHVLNRGPAAVRSPADRMFL